MVLCKEYSFPKCRTFQRYGSLQSMALSQVWFFPRYGLLQTLVFRKFGPFQSIVLCNVWSFAMRVLFQSVIIFKVWFFSDLTKYLTIQMHGMKCSFLTKA